MARIGFKGFSVFVLFAAMLISLCANASAFVWVGYIKNSTGSYVEGANVSVNSYDPAAMNTIAATYSALTNSSGYFAVTVTEGAGYMYEPKIRVYSGNLALEVGPSLPIFPLEVFQMGLNGTTLHTQDAVSINLTMYRGEDANNLTTFSGQITDADKGYFIQSFSSSNGTMAYLPSDRNYTISVYGGGPPVSYTLNNISSYSSPKRIDFKENTSVTFYSLTGYAIVTENNTADVNFTGFYYSDFTGNMVFLEDVPHPMYEGDNVNPGTGYYNLSLPGGAPMLLMVYANDSSKHYMGLLNLSMTQDRELNVTLHTLAGTYRADSSVINTSRVQIDVKDASTGAAISGGGFVEIETTYSTTYTDLTIKWEKDISSDTNSLNVSLFNSSTAKITIFSSNYAPRKYKAGTAALNAANATITVGLYTMNLSTDTGTELDMNMVFYKSNSTCDVISPPAGCLMSNFSSDDQFNPMQALLGGDVSMRLVQDNGVVVHYADVDMLKSGPPDIMMTPNGANATSGASFESAWKFGSKGPDTYDHILIGVPYNPATLDEASSVNLSIPVLYDEDWAPQWNTTTMGTGVNLTDYAAYDSTWFSSAGMNCNAAANLSQGQNCSMNTSTNMVWLRLPHFSAVGPTLKGTAVVATTTTTTTTTSSGGSGGGSVSGAAAATGTALSEASVDTGPALAGDVIKFALEKGSTTTYSFDIITVRADNVDIKLSTGEKSVIRLGEPKEFDMNNDGSNDISINLYSIKGEKAYMKISMVEKPVVSGQEAPEAGKETQLAPEAQPAVAPGQKEDEGDIVEKTAGTSLTKIAGIAILALAAIMLGVMAWHKHMRKIYEKTAEKININDFFNDTKKK
ncbi:hypothetical protein COV19_00385 [Candidatus Woesearchaeota archaeon CG10_big_fil_rev_8_21_14_0_10_44_13]|nr:MAG: hypothetical protein COV19_00385 [Candidatus Woesearchaeota archaeon CG10_big_fil_rev_8_21_14_0_10_44_13]